MPTVGQRIIISGSGKTLTFNLDAYVPANTPHKVYRGVFFDTPHVFQWVSPYQQTGPIYIEPVLNHEDIYSSCFVQVTYGV